MNLYDLSHPSKKKKQQLVKESRLAEFAPPGGGGSDRDWSDEELKQFAAEWRAGNEDRRIEQLLRATGWDIGWAEGYIENEEDEPGVFVMASDETEDKTYQDWPPGELEQLVPTGNKGVAEGTSTVKHRIGLTVTDPNHPMVSKRNEPFQRTVRVPGADAAKAINAAIAHYRRKGYKVHDHHYMGTVDYTVNEFAIDGGGGNNGHWYTDGEIGDRVGDAWFEEFDVSNDMFNIDARGEKAKQALVNYANQWFDNKGYNVNVVGVETNEEDHDLKWYIVGSLDEPQVDEAAPDWLRHTAGAATGALGAVGASFPGAAIAGPIGGAVAGAYGAKAGYELGAGAADWVYDKVTGKRVSADKAIDEAIPLDTLRSTAGSRVKDTVSARLKQNGPLGRDDPFGPEGRFVGDSGPAEISTTVAQHKFASGDQVKYKPTGEPARIEDLSPDGKRARIHVASGMGGRYFNCKVADLRAMGQGVAEGAPISGNGGAVDNFKQQMANNTELAYQKGVAEGGYQHGFADPNAPSLGGSGRKDDEGNSEFDDRQRRQTGMIFYNVDDAETARAIGLQQTRTGKWYLRTGNRHAQQSADRAFGLGRIWYPESVAEAGVFGFMTPDQPKPEVKKPKLTLSQIRDLSKQEDEKVAKYVRSNDLPDNPDHMRVVHDDVELSELSNELLGRYKKELGVRASAADRAGDYDKGHEYFKKINRATMRQGDNDARRHAEKENDMMETRLNMMRKAGYDL